MLEEAEHLHRERHDQRAVLLRGDVHHGLQQAQLDRARSVSHGGCGVGQPLGRLALSIGDDPDPALTFGLGLLGHGAHHRLRKGDVLDLHPLAAQFPGFLGRSVPRSALPMTARSQVWAI
ncbi:hypothetical protein OG864_03665 [Streptomyces sp. NBC_00124]|uniref:hypothetical protein n=1 Tax=Streptomyces sp. NBC_00124 TaxID=2975662 RepID=UPI0022595621|nr:hypothetical protein [Streptomyces sp. NBC_00124]MCX5357813.1 hypothetical protein [Streptomyces sp. NBC_00124]